MSLFNRVARVGLLMAGAAALLFWITHHAQVSFADGLRYVREAHRIGHGDLTGGLLRGIDHPLHPLAIAGAHALIGGDGPYEWQAAAQCAAVIALVLAVVPVYLLGRDLFDDETTAWLGAVLVFANPVTTYIGVNVLSESTFLLFWAWGLWASVRFLREGRFVWLPWAIGFGALAYLTRPEGLLLHLALVATLLLLPLHRMTRINWPRWWGALALLVIGPALLVGPYVAYKGGLGTKPAVARVLGTLPRSAPEAVERERTLPAGQTAVQTYAIAVGQVLKAFGGVVTWPLVPLAVLGLAVARPVGDRARTWLFLGLIVAASAVALVRLHATGGYCTVRHALVPGLILTLSAAHGFAWLMRSTVIDGRRLGLGEGRIRPGPAVWALLLGSALFWPYYARTSAPYSSSFAPYRIAGSWLHERRNDGALVLDLTEWTLFFCGRPGFGISRIAEATSRPETRWVVLRESDLTGPGRSAALARTIVAGRAPVMRCPDLAATDQLQVLIYDLATPANATTGVAAAVPGREGAPRRR